jgi:hypothetical protein
MSGFCGKPGVIAAIAVLLGLCMYPRGVAAQGCGDLPLSRLRVFTATADQVIEHQTTAVEIEQLTSLAAAPPHALLAISYVIDGHVTLINNRIIHGPDGYCVDPATIAINLGIVERHVFMTPEAAGEHCIHEALLAHERDHARIVAAGLHDFVQERRSELARKLTMLKNRPASDPTTAVTAFEAGLYRELQNLHTEFSTELLSTLRGVGDNPMALAQLRAACGGLLGSLEAAARAAAGRHRGI